MVLLLSLCGVANVGGVAENLLALPNIGWCCIQFDGYALFVDG